ncbi:TlpA family protein disulfide reductase [Zhouia amylolytica]|uniref:TlpA family protein disulfide reductase n=1 Tax=Zhouia amylolytica TaxID=376730 RepID=UPI0020CCCF9D|nr:TlpA disulfide reductase family protein [Zhouia amylolytica]MCQ0112061.1 TlpA family protein disulfide reductase [Zhouia amylolytica]
MKLHSILFIILSLILTNNRGYPQSQSSQEEKDWKEFNELKLLYYNTPEQEAKAKSPSLLVYKRYEDEVYSKRSVMAEKFMNNYPESKYYKEVLQWYLSAFFLPVFIRETIEKERLEILNAFYGPDKWKGADRFRRVLPINKSAMELWLEKGNKYVEKFLASNASPQDKFEIEQSLINRDVFIANRWFVGLERESLEEDFWEQFYQFYWESIYQRIEQLFYKYSELESMTHYANRFVKYVTDHSKVPSLRKYYWQRFYEFTNEKEHAKHKGISALQKVALDNLKALNTQDMNDNKAKSKALEMSFTAMDGTKVNLKNMRGKVVLIDFWSTYCPPCIKEMPHVKELYDKYKDNGFEVIGIIANGEESREQIMKIMEKTRATWPQRLDKASNVSVSYHSLYNINSLPTVWLLDKEGRIVDRNARGERLEPLIRKYLELD